ncbi:MAG TPA: YraN family protein [Beijerinckiaceae bacterium]|nr:YraN family protein [Beijerinckiaceae bacterium]
MTRHHRAYGFGLDAEWLAELLLRAKGYRILARRFAAAGGEVDLVARRGGTLIFVEVKARAGLEQALEAITPLKRQRISRAARAYLGRLEALPAIIRMDAVFVSPHALPRHLENFFELDL